MRLHQLGSGIVLVDISDLPESRLGRAEFLENLMTERATGGSSADTTHYEHLRREFMGDPVIKPLLPDFVRTSRTLDAFWPAIKSLAGTYAERRQIISTEFTALIEFLENQSNGPGEASVSELLLKFDLDGVHAVWSKALLRRNSDPEEAITLARTLLETVCKRVLDEQSVPYTDKVDLPKLYAITAKSLNLAPDQHIEEPIRAILGGAMNLVNGIGTLRNRFSDAHGRGGKPVKPSPRHASLAVNMAGAMASFLLETFHERAKSGG